MAANDSTQRNAGPVFEINLADVDLIIARAGDAEALAYAFADALKTSQVFVDEEHQVSVACMLARLATDIRVAIERARAPVERGAPSIAHGSAG